MRTFKFIPPLIVGLFLLISPQVADAQDSAGKPFCQNVETIGSNMVTSMEAKRQINPPVNFDSQVQAANQKLSNARSEADRVRNKHFELILTKLKDPNQKSAIQNYRESLSEAINARRNSVDAAQREFISQLTDLINKHRHAVATEEEEFMNSVKQSIEDAKLNCASDPQSQTVRAQFASKLKIAKADFGIKKQSLAQNSLEYRQLVTKRNIAISQAINTYQQSERQAKQQFLSEVNIGR